MTGECTTSSSVGVGVKVGRRMTGLDEPVSLDVINGASEAIGNDTTTSVILGVLPGLETGKNVLDSSSFIEDTS